MCGFNNLFFINKYSCFCCIKTVLVLSVVKLIISHQTIDFGQVTINIKVYNIYVLKDRKYIVCTHTFYTHVKTNGCQ